MTGAGAASAPDRARQGGFTLLELLVAATLLAMIVALGAGGLRFGARVWERTEAASEALIETRAARRFIAALIEGIEPVRIRDGTRHPPVLLYGSPRSLVAAAPLPSALAPAGPHLVALEAEPSGEGYDLVLRWRPLGSERPRPEFGPEDGRDVLLRGLSDATFRYAGPGGASDRWTLGPAAPSLIELSVRWPGGGPAWPVLAAAPRIGAAP